MGLFKNNKAKQNEKKKTPLKDFFNKATNTVISVWTGITSAVETVASIATTVWTAVKEAPKAIVEAVKETYQTIKSAAQVKKAEKQIRESPSWGKALLEQPLPQSEPKLKDVIIDAILDVEDDGREKEITIEVDASIPEEEEKGLLDRIVEGIGDLFKGDGYGSDEYGESDVDGEIRAEENPIKLDENTNETFDLHITEIEEGIDNQNEAIANALRTLIEFYSPKYVEQLNYQSFDPEEKEIVDVNSPYRISLLLEASKYENQGKNYFSRLEHTWTDDIPNVYIYPEYLYSERLFKHGGKGTVEQSTFWSYLSLPLPPIIGILEMLTREASPGQKLKEGDVYVYVGNAYAQAGSLYDYGPDAFGTDFYIRGEEIIYYQDQKTNITVYPNGLEALGGNDD